MKSKFYTGLVIALSLAISAAAIGCGGLSDSQKQDAANVAGGFNSFGSSTTSSGLTGLNEELAATDPDMGAIPATIHSLYWLSFFQAQAHVQSLQQNLTAGDTSDLTVTCPAAGTTKTINGVSCTQSCPTTSSIQNSCTIPDGGKEVCNGTTYSFTTATVTAGVDFSGMTTSSTGTLSISVGISANVTGGSLTGQNLACSIVVPITLPVTAANLPAVSCSNFSCTYNSKSISCSDLQAKFSGGSCKSS